MKHRTPSQKELVKSVRKQWDFNPSSRIVESKKAYSRKDKYKSLYYCEGFVD